MPRTAQEESFRSAATDIAYELKEIEKDAKRRSGDDPFRRQVNGLLGDIELAARITSADEKQQLIQSLSQWTEVPYLKPELISRGYRPSTWIESKGSLQHVPAEIWTQLFFQSPLRGQFEVAWEHSTYGYREVSVAWGMHAAQPQHDLKAVQVTKMMHGARNIEGNASLPSWDRKAESRFKVDGNKVTTWTNGVQIHEETFDGPLDPWLVIQAGQPTNDATIDNLRILGSPEIPAEIDLIDMAGWAAWRADIYAESHSTQADATTPWKRVGDELTGQLQEKRGAEYLESLLLYQRPMLEDGVIEFESWYEPGTFEVHPSLGMNAYLLRPDGIRLHRLTNAQYEDSSLLPDNEEAIDSSASAVPLKEKEWNRIRLTLKGDNLVISVNGAEVASVELTSASNERQFGLFRYSNKSRCRVRNLVYRGDWPKVLPIVDQQELAYPAEGPFALNSATATFDQILNQPLETLKSDGIAILGTKDRLVVGEEGLRISMHDSKGYATFPGLIRRRKIEGDVEVTAVYRDLEMSPVKEGWGLGVGLTFYLDTPEKTRVECHLSLNKDSQLVYKTQLNRSLPDGTNRTYGQIILQDAPTSGRLRMVRKGGQVHCLAGGEEGEPFRLLASYAIGNTPISSISFGSKCSDSVGQAAVTLERLTIREGETAVGSELPAN